MNDRIIFWQDWGTFYPITLVCCRWDNYKQVIDHLKKTSKKDKSRKEWYLALENKDEEFDTHHFSRWSYKKRTYSLLWLKDYKDDFKHHNILAHELLHGVSFLMPDFLNPQKENEAFAYQHTYLMNNIHKKLL